MTAVPRLVVTAPSSGHGKTAVAVGLLAAFAATGLRPAGFKVGPDHTDAAYLGLAAGHPGRNLDPKLVGAQRIAPLFVHGAAGSDIAVVEGTMGLFDSLDGRSEADSTAGVAGLLRAPVVLVIDVAAMGQSVAALVHGFRAYDELVWLGGVILNRVASDRHLQLLTEALDEIGVPVLGALRRGDLATSGPAALPPRHNGVVPALHRTVEATRSVRRLGERVGAAVDLERLLALARSAPRTGVEPWSAADAVGPTPWNAADGPRPVVALAGAAGQGYGYVETAELLASAGATVVTVDPLRDEALPDRAEALVVCAGLPEAYVEELSANTRLTAEVAGFARAGHPVLAEGTGLLWLAREVDGRPMCGVLDASAVTTDRMVVGYREAVAQTPSPVGDAGARVVGYKHHRSVLNPRAGRAPAWNWNGGTPEGFVWQRVHGSLLSLHWAGSPEIAVRLLAAADPERAAALPAAATARQPARQSAAEPTARLLPPVVAQPVPTPAPPQMAMPQAGPQMSPPPGAVSPAQFGPDHRDADSTQDLAAMRGLVMAAATVGAAEPSHTSVSEPSRPNLPEPSRANLPEPFGAPGPPPELFAPAGQPSGALAPPGQAAHPEPVPSDARDWFGDDVPAQSRPRDHDEGIPR